MVREVDGIVGVVNVDRRTKLSGCSYVLTAQSLSEKSEITCGVVLDVGFAFGYAQGYLFSEICKRCARCESLCPDQEVMKALLVELRTASHCQLSYDVSYTALLSLSASSPLSMRKQMSAIS